MEWFIISRDMHVLCNPSTDAEYSLPIDDSGVNYGQRITLANNVAIGTYDFKTFPDHEDSKYITEGNYIAFKDKYGKDRLYTIMSIEGDEKWDVHCEDIGLDLINEVAGAWNVSAEPVETTMNRCLHDTGWSIGVNEIADRKRATKYESRTDSHLARIGMIMNAFDAECEFVIEMNGAKVTKQVVNIYKSLGEDKVQQVFIDDIDLIALSRSGSIEDLCTCMICYGKEENGVRTTIESIEYDDGRYYSPKGHIRIYDREAHQKWSRYRAYDYTGQGEFDGYVNGAFEYETDSPQELFNRGLSELKQRNDKKVSYEAELYDLQADIGDTIRIADNRYQEKLYLSARVQEVQNHYTVNGEDTGKLANYLLMESKRTQDVEDMLKELQGKVVSIDHAEISYQIGESGTEPPDGEWSSEPVDAEAGKYLWTRTITYYTNSSRNTAYSIAKSGLNGEKGESGDKGDKGDTGPAGKGISSTEVTYQASTSGTSIHTGTWVTSIPSVAAGSYLWTRTIITYTDKTSTTSYAVGKMGNTGAAGKGIKSTSITYQAHSNGTTAPTGTWTDLVPTTSAEKPYLWSRTILTYTDNTTSTTYSVGSTPDGVLEEIRKVLRYDNTKIVLGQDGEPTSLELTNEGLTVKSDSENIISVTGENREVTSGYNPSGATFTRRYGKIVNADGTIISCGNTVAENDYEIAEMVQYTGADPLLSGREAGIDITVKIAGAYSGTNETATSKARISMHTIQNSRASIASEISSYADRIHFSGKEINFYPTVSFGINGESIGFKGKGIGLYPTEELELGIPVVTGNCNTLTKSCTWYLGNGSTNRPLDQNGWLISRSYSTDYCHQTYITNTGGIYRRMMRAGKWGIWQGGYANVKKLWSGTLSKGGSVTVANLSLFDTFILGTSSGTAMLIGTRYYDQYQNRGTTVLFTAGHDDGTTSYLYKATTSMSGTTFKLTSCSVHTLDPTGCGGHAATVKSLYGVM
ncbi:phage minor structural protein%2C N-terminal region [Allocoprococcus comes]|uniref:Phage minor structural protein, N-terminal region n=1 Tax=Coprococcus comes TaxID=410072 RepID=A0A173ZDP8_9FIRM|nr:phage tail spike protein [Coprococcus comes]CUN74532.1 phage minor structural protein%2C N-terminal region [Coprococcus comes]